MIANLQCQCETDRRTTERQLKQFERRLQVAQDEHSRDREGYQKHSELQGCVNGLLEEVQSLTRRIDGLDERLLSKTTSIEDFIRRSSQKLEQQATAVDHKAQLSTAACEEMQKRQTAKARRVEHAMEDIGTRLTKLEDSQSGSGSSHMESILASLQQRQVMMESEIQSLHAIIAETPAETSYSLTDHPHEDAIRIIESNVADLVQKTSSQHAESQKELASLRVKVSSQMQRVESLVERTESVHGPAIDAVRAEIFESQAHSKRELENSVDAFRKMVEMSKQAQDEALSDLQDNFREVQAKLAVMRMRSEDDPAVLALVDRAKMHEHQANEMFEQLRACTGDSTLNCTAHSIAEASDAPIKMEELLERLQAVESNDSNTDFVDRHEVERLHALVRGTADQVNRLSERIASSEITQSTVQQKVEALQAKKHSVVGFDTEATQQVSSEGISAIQAQLTAVNGQVSDMVARLLVLESEVSNGAIHESSHSRSCSDSEHSSNCLEPSIQKLIARIEKVEQKDIALDMQHQIESLSCTMGSVHAEWKGAVEDVRKAVEMQTGETHHELQSLSQQCVDMKAQIDSLSGDETSGSSMQSLTEQVQDVAKKLLDIQGTAGKCSDQCESIEKKVAACETQATSFEQQFEEIQGREDTKKKDLDARINWIQKYCDSTREHLQVVEAGLEQNFKECECRQDEKAKDVLDRLSDVEEKLAAKDKDEVVIDQAAEPEVDKVMQGQSEMNRRLEFCEKEVDRVKRLIDASNEKQDEIGENVSEEFSGVKQQLKAIEGKFATVLFDDGTLNELKASQSTFQNELNALKDRSGSDHATVQDSVKIGQMAHEIRALSSAQDTLKASVSDDVAKLQKQCQNVQTAGQSLREIHDMFEQKVELGLGTQVKNVCEQTRDLATRLKEIEHEIQENEVNVPEHKSDSSDRIEKIVQSKIETLSDDFVDLEVYKQSLEQTLNSMAVLSDRIGAAEEQIKTLKEDGPLEQCRPEPLTSVGISGYKLSREFSDDLSTTWGGQTKNMSVGSSGSRSTPRSRSGSGEEQSPKPPSTAESETETDEKLSRPPEVEDKVVPPTIERVEGAENGASIGQGCPKRDASPDSVSSGNSGKRRMMAAAAFFSARHTPTKETATKETDVEPDTNGSQGTTSTAEPSCTPDDPSEKTCPNDPLEQSGASVDVIVGMDGSTDAALDQSVADSLELEKCDFVESIAAQAFQKKQLAAAPQKEAAKDKPLAASKEENISVEDSKLGQAVQEKPVAAPQEEVTPVEETKAADMTKLQVGVQPETKSSTAFVTQHDEQYDEEAFDDDDISEEIDESIECFDESASLKGGFESDGESC